MFNQISALWDVLNHPLNKQNRLRAFFRIIWWKLNQIILKIPAIVEMEKGVVCVCYPDSSYSGLVVYKRLPEYNEMKYVYSNLKEGEIFIDIGANIGAVSLLAASKVGSKGIVYAFEPDKNVLPRLYENINLNNFHNVEVINSAVSDKISKLKFVNEGLSEVSHLAYTDKQKNGKSNLISSTTLDRFLKQRKIKKIKMVKVDVEGAEMKVLKGARNALLSTKLLLIEINKNSIKYGYTFSQSLNFIKNLGFYTYIFEASGKLTKIDDPVAFDKSINILAINQKWK